MHASCSQVQEAASRARENRWTFAWSRQGEHRAVAASQVTTRIKHAEARSGRDATRATMCQRIKELAERDRVIEELRHSESASIQRAGR